MQNLASNQNYTQLNSYVILVLSHNRPKWLSPPLKAASKEVSPHQEIRASAGDRLHRLVFDLSQQTLGFISSKVQLHLSPNNDYWLTCFGLI